MPRQCPGARSGSAANSGPVAEISIGLRGRPRTSRRAGGFVQKKARLRVTTITLLRRLSHRRFSALFEFELSQVMALVTMVCNSKTIVCIRKNAVCHTHRIRPNAEPCWMEAQSSSSGNRGGGPHSKTAIGNARLLRMALYRRRLWGRLRRRPPHPLVGETAMTSHAMARHRMAENVFQAWAGR